MSADMYDVVKVSLDDGTVALMAERKTEKSAEAIECMAVMNLGVDGHFFTSVPHGKYAEGDNYEEQQA